MNSKLRTVLFLSFAMLLAGGFGAWLGVAHGVRLAHSRPDLHELIHHALDLTADQNRKLAPLEAQFTMRRGVLLHDRDVASHGFSNALDAEHSLGPRSRAALTTYYQLEEQLEEATILHVQAMREILSPDQQQKLDFNLRHSLPAERP